MSRKVLAAMILALLLPANVEAKKGGASTIPDSAPLATQTSSKTTVDIDPIGFIGKLNMMPANFWPSPSEQPVRQTARENWITQTFSNGDSRFQFSGTLIKVESIKNSINSFSNGKIGDKGLLVRIDCGIVNLWGHPLKMTAYSRVFGVSVEDAAGWSENAKIRFAGKIALERTWPAQVPQSIDIAISQPLELVKHPVSETQPSDTVMEFTSPLPAPPPVASQYTKYLNTMPRELWPVPGELRSTAQLRADWVKANVPGRVHEISFSGQLLRATPTQIPKTQEVMSYAAGLQPIITPKTVYIDGVTVSILCGHQLVWGLDVNVVTSATVSNVSAADIAQWDKTKVIMITGVPAGVPSPRGAEMRVSVNPARANVTPTKLATIVDTSLDKEADDKIREAIKQGRPLIGMTKDQLGEAGYLDEDGKLGSFIEDSNGKTMIFTGGNTEYSVHLSTEGRVTSVVLIGKNSAH